MAAVEVSESGPVMELKLNRPRKLNALNEEVRRLLQTAIDDVAGRTDIRVVVLLGAGRCFSAGADLDDRADPPPAGPPSPLRQRTVAGRWQHLLDSMERLPQATVAGLHSHVIGGAALLAAACDLRVASDDVAFSIPELSIGIPLTWAGLPRLAREIGLPRTRDLVLAGRVVTAAEAASWGLASRVVPAADLYEATWDLARRLADQPEGPLAISVAGLRALGRATSGAELAWADPDLLRWSLQENG